MAGVPIAIAYAWYGVVWPLTWNQASDFRQVYLEGARLIATGGDPYQCSTGHCSGHTQGWLGAAGAVYPPFALWIVQPLTALDPAFADGLALIVANLLLALFILLVIRTLGVRDWQERLLIALLCMGFAPTLTEIQNRNFQLVVLVMGVVLLAAWRSGDRWWGGAALGVGLAIKLFQAPILLLGAWARRWWIVSAAAATWVGLWLIAVPSLLPEYLLQVVPSVSQGSGEEMNVSPLAAVARLIHPESLYLEGRGVDALVLVLTAGLGLAVLVITGWRLGRPRPDADGRGLEVAASLAATPLLLTLVWAGQLVLLLLPMVVLLDRGIRIHSRGLLGSVAASWLLIGPLYLGFTNAFADGFGFPALFQVWSDSALAGVVILWLASLFALRERKHNQLPDA
ncbi:MAG TPA: glycosyltransferase family 87 protein [Candidatus Limnocylindrales bacterium]|nr:glycosyltransferase family 87 protein [Candidatus Limnocylindrales bacterium]